MLVKTECDLQMVSPLPLKLLVLRLAMHFSPLYKELSAHEFSGLGHIWGRDYINQRSKYVIGVWTFKVGVGGFLRPFTTPHPPTYFLLFGWLWLIKVYHPHNIYINGFRTKGHDPSFKTVDLRAGQVSGAVKFQ